MAFIANMCLASQKLKKCPLSQDVFCSYVLSDL